MHLKVLLPRQSPKQATPGTSELLRALGARLNTTAGFSHHFHQEADRRLRETKRWKRAHAQRRPRPSPLASSPRPFGPLGVVKCRFPRKSGTKPNVPPSWDGPSSRGARVGPCLLVPDLGVQSQLLRGSESPPRLPQPSLSCKLLENSFPLPGPAKPGGVLAPRPSLTFHTLPPAPRGPSPPAHGPEAEGRPPRRSAGVSAGAGHGIPGDAEPR